MYFELRVNKGVSDLKTCMDYFALPGRSCKNDLFSHPSKGTFYSEEVDEMVKMTFM